MQGEDGLDESGDSGCGASQFPEESPGLEGGHGLLDKCSDLRMGPIRSLLSGGRCLPPSQVRDADRAAGASVSLVCSAHDVGLGQGFDDAVLTGCADVVYSSGQGR